MKFDLALLVHDGHHGVFQVDQVLPLKFHQREANVVSFVGIVVLNGYKVCRVVSFRKWAEWFLCLESFLQRFVAENNLGEPIQWWELSKGADRGEETDRASVSSTLESNRGDADFSGHSTRREPS